MFTRIPYYKNHIKKTKFDYLSVGKYVIALYSNIQITFII